ncbi:MAG: metallophosphoesterase family protein [Polyangiaceae bacterium]
MRIAHFSDLHVLSLEGVAPHRFLNKRITGYANLRMKRGHVHHPRFVRAIAREIKKSKVDHVVITGDLTNLALEQEFEAVHALLREELGLSPRDVSIIPGNHDLYTRGSLRSQRFVKYFGEFMTSDLPELGVQIALGRFPFVRLRGPAAIIGLSTAVPRLPLFATGRVGKAQTDALARILAHPEVRKRTPVVLMHHPAHNPVSTVKRLLTGLNDAAILLSTVKDVPRGLLLHGHLHTRILRKVPTDAGSLHSVGATSASLDHEDDAKMAGFNLYEIGDDGEVARIEAHVLDREHGSFAVGSMPKLLE